MSNAEPRIRAGTALLRTSRDVLHVRLRELLRGKGVDPQTSLLARFMPEGRTYASGVVVTEAGRVHEFEISFPDSRYEAATLRMWDDVTASYHSRPFRRDVATALELLLGNQTDT